MAREGLTIEARGLVKVYGKTRALDGIDPTVRRGQVFGFFGPERGGQDHHHPHPGYPGPAGRRHRPCPGVRRGGREKRDPGPVAVTGQFASLDDDLTGYENLIVFGRLRGLSRAASRQRAG